MAARQLTRGPRHPLLLGTKQARTTYIAPSSLSGWAAYRARIFPNFQSSAESIASEFQNVQDAARAVELITTNSTSMALTLLGALERTLPDLQKLCIHVVAAASKECETQNMMEELLHYLPCLDTRRRNVHRAYPARRVREETAPQRRVQRGRRRVAVLVRAMYHDFACSPEYRANPPDLVARFNTGMSEVDVPGWERSGRVVLSAKVPAVFTAYTFFEAYYDTCLLNGEGARFLQHTEKNPWRGRASAY
ncbi:hypothetical protein B0H17DRAFT_1140930 [Mycena rosella]|uniref:Mitochondrial splicing suppressor 51-like C-terminal domain-containing protein n=1 Tax=Mycena rosella TaxID=1033263 RepID=A0AAD7D0V3_MYCRO|nr:hypothetical protein B0H17DRAFT_1140930 [Mycena rosella]